MNSRDRVLAALRRQEPDRVPYCEIGVDRAVARQVLDRDVVETPAMSVEYQPYQAKEHKAIAAALPGPTFLVNTERGALNSRASCSLSPGWHHLVGIYDGHHISLVIDGILCGQRSGGGRLHTCDADVVIGRIQDGLGYFGGHILEVRISSLARSLDWLRTEHRNLSENARYTRVGEEEYAPHR